MDYSEKIKISHEKIEVYKKIIPIIINNSDLKEKNKEKIIKLFHNIVFNYSSEEKIDKNIDKIKSIIYKREKKGESMGNVPTNINISDVDYDISNEIISNIRGQISAESCLYKLLYDLKSTILEERRAYDAMSKTETKRDDNNEELPQKEQKEYIYSAPLPGSIQEYENLVKKLEIYIKIVETIIKKAKKNKVFPLLKNQEIIKFDKIFHEWINTKTPIFSTSTEIFNYFELDKINIDYNINLNNIEELINDNTVLFKPLEKIEIINKLADPNIALLEALKNVNEIMNKLINNYEKAEKSTKKDEEELEEEKIGAETKKDEEELEEESIVAEEKQDEEELEEENIVAEPKQNEKEIEEKNIVAEAKQDEEEIEEENIVAEAKQDEEEVEEEKMGAEAKQDEEETDEYASQQLPNYKEKANTLLDNSFLKFKEGMEISKNKYINYIENYIKSNKEKIQSEIADLWNFTAHMENGTENNDNSQIIKQLEEKKEELKKLKEMEKNTKEIEKIIDQIDISYEFRINQLAKEYKKLQEEINNSPMSKDEYEQKEKEIIELSKEGEALINKYKEKMEEICEDAIKNGFKSQGLLSSNQDIHNKDTREHKRSGLLSSNLDTHNKDTKRPRRR